VKRVQTNVFEGVGQRLDARLVRDGGERIGCAGRGFGRVLAPRTVHLIELLGHRVVGLDVLIGDRPRRRDPAMVAKLTEVLGTQAIEGSAVQLRGAADEVVDLRLKRVSVAVVPGVGRDVAVVREHVLRRPVARSAGEPATALEQQDALARRREMSRKRAAARARADDDDVIRVHDRISSTGSVGKSLARPIVAPRAGLSEAA
jgi:hypothetical protein